MPDVQATQWCKLNSSMRWDCFVGETKAGERVRVTFTSSVINDANFLGYRASRGALPVVLLLK